VPFVIVHAHVKLGLSCVAHGLRMAVHALSHLPRSSRSRKTFDFLSVPPFLLPCDSRHAKLARVRWGDA
jgi:hypothetical protein